MAATARILDFLRDQRPEGPCLVVDLDVIADNYRAFRRAMPDTRIFYAVKANPAPEILKMLADMGSCFDTASVPEIEMALAAGATPDRISFGNTIKKERDIARAHQLGVKLFAVDSDEEVEKVARAAPAASVFCRILTDGAGAEWPLSRKFGCDPENLLALARKAHDLGLIVRGLSFHVGSQAADPSKHVEAIDACAKLLAVARREKLGPCDTLDIGGGFPIDYSQRAPIIHEFCAPIRTALAKLPKRVRVIAEPGRYIAGPAAIGVASVMGRAEREGLWWYYLADGLYGSYSGQLFDHARYPIETLKRGKRYPSVLAGPTCDSIDVISENILLPELEPGDLIVGRAMGAYTWASASEFNFFPKATVVSVNSNRNDRGSVLTIER